MGVMSIRPSVPLVRSLTNDIPEIRKTKKKTKKTTRIGARFLKRLVDESP
jgi:hypothetical protein